MGSTRDHRLAGKESVTLDDIADEPLPRAPDPTWNAFWRIDPRPDGSPAPDGPLVEAVEAIEDKLELIAAGQAMAIVSAGLHATLRHDLTTVPLHGLEPGHRATSCWRPAPTITTACSRPSAGPPEPISQVPPGRTGERPPDTVIGMTG